MKRFKIKFILVVSIITTLLILKQLFITFDEAVSTFAHTVGENRVCEIVNQCILDSVEKQSAEYGSICAIHYDSAGKITAITVNPESVNKLKGETISSIIHALKDGGKEAFFVPLGTLLGSRLFSAKGPNVEIEIIPLGTVSSELVQTFTAAGINQTLHSLYLNVRTSVKISAPFSAEAIDISTTVCIAESVIIGDIPFVYSD